MLTYRSQHLARLLASLGLHGEVLHEDPRKSCIRSTALVFVGSLDVDLLGGQGIRICEGRSLRVGTGDTVDLRREAWMTRRRSAAPAGTCTSSNLNESEVRVMTASPGASTPPRSGGWCGPAMPG